MVQELETVSVQMAPFAAGDFFAGQEVPGEPFQSSGGGGGEAASKPLVVLAVDDDPGFQRAAAFAMASRRVLGRPLKLLQAYSRREALTMLAGVPDIAIMLVDVVMESEDAGLRLVDDVRQNLRNSLLRIILVTGQTGSSPVNEVMNRYDINDYWSKADLSAERLDALLIANARQYSHLQTLAKTRQSLERVVEANAVLFSGAMEDTVRRSVIGQAARIFDVPEDGLLCARPRRNGLNPNPMASDDGPMIVAAEGLYQAYDLHPLLKIEDPALMRGILDALESKESLQHGKHLCLYFVAEPDGMEFVACLKMTRPLTAIDQHMMNLLATSLRGAFTTASSIARLEQVAYEDSLLKIPNRNALAQAISRYLNRQDRADADAAGLLDDGLGSVPDQAQDMVLMLVDIDNFADINIALGVSCGDAVLSQAARALGAAFPPDVIVARIGNDIFGLLGPSHIVTTDAVNAAFSRFTVAVEDPSEQMSATMVNASTATLLLRNFGKTGVDAITAAYHTLRESKRVGGNRHVTHFEEQDGQAQARFRLLQDLRAALKDPLPEAGAPLPDTDAIPAYGMIAIALQPKVRLSDGGVVGFEALARWVRPDGSMIPPDMFIPLAETTGLILDLGCRVFELSARAAVRLAAIGCEECRIAVNVSAVQLAQDNLLDQFRDVLDRHGVRPQQLDLEVTETAAMQDPERVQDQLKMYGDLGFRIAIDDFGTGFSSLAYLRSLPAHELKIDRAFVSEIGVRKDDKVLADMIISLGKRMGLTVIAEGVETQEQWDWLRVRGCELGQGYFFGKPMLVDQALDWVAIHKSGKCGGPQ